MRSIHWFKMYNQNIYISRLSPLCTVLSGVPNWKNVVWVRHPEVNRRIKNLYPAGMNCFYENVILLTFTGQVFQSEMYKGVPSRKKYVGCTYITQSKILWSGTKCFGLSQYTVDVGINNKYIISLPCIWKLCFCDVWRPEGTSFDWSLDILTNNACTLLKHT